MLETLIVKKIPGGNVLSIKLIFKGLSIQAAAIT
jgi:hypothetical protein